MALGIQDWKSKTDFYSNIHSGNTFYQQMREVSEINFTCNNELFINSD